MKSRFVIWAIVSILVVVGVVFIVATSRRGGPQARVTLERVKAEATRAASAVDRLTVRLAEMQKTVPAGAQAPKAVAEAGRLIDEARAGLAKVGTATEVKAAAEDLRQAKQTVRKARRALELAAKGQAAPQGL